MSIKYKDTTIAGTPDMKVVFDAIYPIGSIWVTVSDAEAPGTSYGLKWEEIQTGVTLWSSSSNLGEKLDGSLPKIEGGLPIHFTNFTSRDGAIQSNNFSSSINSGKITEVSSTSYGYRFRAEDSNDVYKATAGENVVRPDAIATKMYKRVS